MQSEVSVLNDGEQVHPFRAKQFIPCPITHCPGKWHLYTFYKDGRVLERPFNDGPFYRCDREGCYWHDHIRGVHELNSEWVRDDHEGPKKPQDKQDWEKQYEVLV
jgi:hypothetical protein